MCARIKRYHVVDSRKGDTGKNRKKVKNMENDFLMEMYCMNPPLSNTIGTMSKCCIFCHFNSQKFISREKVPCCRFSFFSFLDKKKRNLFLIGSNMYTLIVFKRGGFIQYISIKKSYLFRIFDLFFSIFACISLSRIDNMVPLYTDASSGTRNST